MTLVLIFIFGMVLGFSALLAYPDSRYSDRKVRMSFYELFPKFLLATMVYSGFVVGVCKYIY